MPFEHVTASVKKAFNFPLVVRPIEENIASLKLYHGSTLAFKDFCGRFMAQILALIASNEPITILTATLGDTGAAVAHAFYRLNNVQVIILYPKNNWPRIEALFQHQKWELNGLSYGVVDDKMTEKTVQKLANKGYISEPHGAVAYRILRDQLQDGEYGLFLSTARPAKFKQSVDRILAKILPLPTALANRAKLPILSHQLPANFAVLHKFLLTHATK